MNSKFFLFSSLLFAFGLMACSGAMYERPVQTIEGQIDVYSFVDAPTTVEVLRAGKVVSSTPIATDGRFTLYVSPGKGYSIQFKSPGSTVGLVFPRSTGAIDTRFDLLGRTAPFHLGKVVFIGDPTANSYLFKSSGAGVLKINGDNENEGDYECEDGIDPATGAVCVDDEDDEGAMCENDDENEGENVNNQDGDDINCEDGIDPATGLECDGGPDANGQDDDGDNEDGELPAQAAAAEHNLPASVGCQDEDENEDDGDNNNDDQNNQTNNFDGENVD
ncbi:MAG: hypothetical protein CVU59_01660 [Deltaproteobacteria bacterium HGW-Deltaproteobacteria-17]|nr:MAG: hypothetical protein CVU59_01660 [Deltaproteobacteria bacterium HGW-Deltaproteobacteria-17]